MRLNAAPVEDVSVCKAKNAAQPQTVHQDGATMLVKQVPKRTANANPLCARLNIVASESSTRTWQVLSAKRLERKRSNSTDVQN